ncbi:MAG: glycoside hydrolase family 9 protein [Clostridiales bacterium]|jgi:endoglucanase|nr:glycoside hydrolase family 9 protein [Clostridiales bacterium]
MLEKSKRFSGRAILPLCLALVLACGARPASVNAAGPAGDVVVSQAGYGKDDFKVAHVVSSSKLADTGFTLLSGTAELMRGDLQYEGVTWGKHVYTADFSEAKYTGADFTVRSNGVSSYAFPIEDNVWEEYVDEMAAFYRLMRLEDTRAAYPDGYSSIAPSEKAFHPASFLDDGVVGGARYDLSGGWQDAGDYGKYAGNMWVSGNIAISYIRHAQSGAVNFDNDGNGVPDLIDEAKYGCDYLLKFADQLDGALYDFAGHFGFEHPEKWTDNAAGTADDRVATQLATGGSAKGAASLAATSRAIRAALDEGRIEPSQIFAMLAYADRCEAAALTCYEFALANQNGNEGSYASGISNALLFAEVELALLTGQQAYIDSASSRVMGFTELSCTNYWDMRPLAFAEFYPIADAPVRAHIQSELKKQLDYFRTSADDTPYGVLDEFSGFGVNEPHAGYVADAIRYYELFGDSSALKAAVKGMYWMVGDNPWNFSWVSGVGTDHVKYLHTRLDEDAYDPQKAGIIIPGALVSGPNIKDPNDRLSASPWYEDRGLFSDDMNSWRYNEHSLSIQAGLFYSVIALAGMNPGAPENAGESAKLVIASPQMGDYVAGEVKIFAEPQGTLHDAEYAADSAYSTMEAEGGVYAGIVDVSQDAPYSNRRVYVRGADGDGNLTYSSVHFSVAPPLPDPSHPLLYDNFEGAGVWGGAGLEWVNWWNQDGGAGAYEKTTADGRSVGKFSQQPASSASLAKFEPWHDTADLSGYRYLSVTVKNPGYPGLRLGIEIEDGRRAYVVTESRQQIPGEWTTYDFDLEQYGNFDKSNMHIVFWLSQESGEYGEVLVDDIAGTNRAAGSPPAIVSANAGPTSGGGASDYTLAAVYTDADNDSPFAFQAVIDGVIYDMLEADHGDIDYTDGKEYFLTAKLSDGNRSCYFRTTDTASDAVVSEVLANFNAAAPVTPPSPEPGDANFLRGINFNGGSVTIGGNRWLSHGEAVDEGLLISPAPNLATNSHAPVPAVGASTAAMLNSEIWHPDTLSIAQPVANGEYEVYLWIMEDYSPNCRAFGVSIEGQLADSGIASQEVGSWTRYGPYRASIADRELNVGLVDDRGDTLLMGMEIYSAANSANGISLSGGAAKGADFISSDLLIQNFGAAGQNVMAIVAVYGANGELAGIASAARETALAKGEEWRVALTVSGLSPEPGAEYTAKAFVWERDTYAPLCESLDIY